MERVGVGQTGRGCDAVVIRIGRRQLTLEVIRGNNLRDWVNTDQMPLLLLPTGCCAAAPSASVAFSRPPPSRLRASHLLFAFPRLRKYGRRNREPVPTSFDDEEADDEKEDDDDMEEAVDEDIFLKNRPKPPGFGVGKTYTTDIEEGLLREMGLGGGGRKSEPAPAKSVKAADSAGETVTG